MPNVTAVSSSLPFAASQRTSNARATGGDAFGTHLQTASQGAPSNSATGSAAPTVAAQAIDTASDHRAQQQRLTGAQDAAPTIPTAEAADPNGTAPGAAPKAAAGTATGRDPAAIAANPAPTRDATASSPKTNPDPAQSTSATPPPDNGAAIAMDPTVSPAADPDAAKDAATAEDGNAPQEDAAARTGTPAAAHNRTRRSGDETTRKIAADTDKKDATKSPNGTVLPPAIDGAQAAPAPAVRTGTEVHAGAGGARTTHAADGAARAPDAGPANAAPAMTGQVAIAGQADAPPAMPIPAAPDPQALPSVLAPPAAQAPPPPMATSAAPGSSAGADPAGAAAQLAGPVVSLVQGGNGASSMTVSLHPKDLGQVNIRLDRDAAGAVRVTVAATEPATLRGLMADQLHLHAALDAAAVPNADRQIRFELALPSADTGSANAGPGSDGRGGGGNNDAPDWRQENGALPRGPGGASRTDAPILPAAFAAAGIARTYRAGVNITA